MRSDFAQVTFVGEFEQSHFSTTLSWGKLPMERSDRNWSLVYYTDQRKGQVVADVTHKLFLLHCTGWNLCDGYKRSER